MCQLLGLTDRGDPGYWRLFSIRGDSGAMEWAAYFYFANNPAIRNTDYGGRRKGLALLTSGPQQLVSGCH